MFNFTIMIIFSLEKGEVLGNKRGKISRTNTNYNEHIRTIKNTRRLCATYISVDFIVLLACYRLSGGEGGIRTHGPLRSHWFSRPAP